MENKLTGAQAPADLALQSLRDSCAVLAGLSGGTRETACYDAYFVPETFWYHRVLLRPSRVEPELLVSHLAEQVRAGALPPLLGWLERDLPVALLGPLLHGAGYVPVTDQRAMYLSLEGWTPHETPPQVERMRPEECVAWSEASAIGFGKPPETGGMQLLSSAGAADFLLWREEGAIAGGTMLLCRNGNAGIHEVSTRQEYRRRGVATALLLRALDMAAGSGCHCATLQASEAGFPVYAALGFAEAGVIHNWILPPQGQAFS